MSYRVTVHPTKRFIVAHTNDPVEAKKTAIRLLPMKYPDLKIFDTDDLVITKEVTKCLV